MSELASQTRENIQNSGGPQKIITFENHCARKSQNRIHT